MGRGKECPEMDAETKTDLACVSAAGEMDKDLLISPTNMVISSLGISETRFSKFELDQIKVKQVKSSLNIVKPYLHIYIYVCGWWF